MDNIEWIEKWILGGAYGLTGIFFVCEGIRDFRKKEVSVVSCIVAAVLGIFLKLPVICTQWGDMLLGVSVGVFLLIVAYVSRESIGYGDGLILITSGILLGGYRNMMLFCYSLFLCGLLSAFLFLGKKVGRRSRIPFVVFMIPSYLILILTEVLR